MPEAAYAVARTSKLFIDKKSPGLKWDFLIADNKTFPKLNFN
jgi:hypothetical protein